MKHYVKDRGSRYKPIPLSGGKRELAQALAQRAKEEPDRFFKLAHKHIDSSYEIDYLSAIIEGLSESKYSLDRVSELIVKHHTALAVHHVRETCRSLGRYASQPIPEMMVKLMTRWIHNYKDPKHPRVFKDGSEPDLLTEGLNTDRGGALWNLASVLLQEEPPRRSDYLKLAESVVSEKSSSVRAVCIRFLQYAILADPERACAVFKNLVAGDQGLLRSESSTTFVYRVLNKNAGEILWAIDALLSDVDEKAQENGSRLACLASFYYADASDLRDKCLTGNAAMRRGAARVFAANINDSKVAQECRSRLPGFWMDEDETVRIAAAGFLHHVTEANLREPNGLFWQWLDQALSMKSIEHAARVVHNNPTANGELTLKVAQIALKAAGPSISNIQKGEAMLSFYLVPAIVSVYHHSPGLRYAAMDAFEKFEELGCSEVKTAYASVDRL
jgi:hypothetical protein